MIHMLTQTVHPGPCLDFVHYEPLLVNVNADDMEIFHDSDSEYFMIQPDMGPQFHGPSPVRMVDGSQRGLWLFLDNIHH